MCSNFFYFLILLHILSTCAIKCPISCNDGSCCAIGLDQFLCCPFKQGVCCSDAIHCCPQATVCDMESRSCRPIYKNVTENKKLVKASSFNERADNHIICPDNVSVCPASSTCCRLNSTGEGKDWGCCPFPNATCCGDQEHCCPKSTKCDLTKKVCISIISENSNPLSLRLPEKTTLDSSLLPFSSNIIPAFRRIALTSLESNNTVAVSQSGMSYMATICLNRSYECPPQTTCCQMKSGETGCCPIHMGVCCSDGIHCCSQHMTCDPQGLCRASISSSDSSPSVSNIVSTDDIGEKKDDISFTSLTDLETSEIGKKYKYLHAVERFSPTSSSYLINETNSVLCPDQVTCPEESTCCKMPGGTYGCCPLGQAVCCPDQLHCCPAKHRCSDTFPYCIPKPWFSSELSPTDLIVDEQINLMKLDLNMDIKDQICDDKKSKCPDSYTCCKHRHEKYGCCSKPNAVCCPDKIHCCGANEKCVRKKPHCVPKTMNDKQIAKLYKSSLKSLAEEIYIPPSIVSTYEDKFAIKDDEIDQHHHASLQQTLETTHDLSCLNKCGKNRTCCAVSPGVVGCCPMEGAVCCSDNLHCCPFGTYCDLVAGNCRLNPANPPLKLLTTSVVEHNYPVSLDRQIADIICPDHKTRCRGESTCCPTQKHGFHCCRQLNATCCPDMRHCCPPNHRCSKFLPHCVPLDWPHKDLMYPLLSFMLPLQMELIPPLPNDVSTDCLNDMPNCNQNSTCCRHQGNTFCCNLKNAVCCPSFPSCCPSGYTCDSVNFKCLPANRSINELANAFPLERINQKSAQSDLFSVYQACPDGRHTCENEQTCCPSSTANYSCCPLHKATCCSDQMHCCPFGFYCSEDSMQCLALPSSSPLLPSLLTIIGRNAVILSMETPRNTVCPDGKSFCPGENSTCVRRNNGGYACCSLNNAIVCDDDKHCCPAGWNCDTSLRMCVRNRPPLPIDTIASHILRLSESSFNSSIICPDLVSKCPSQMTCCPLSQSEYGCCPLEKAVCCADKVSCCPNGFICDLPSKRCIKLDDEGVKISTYRYNLDVIPIDQASLIDHPLTDEIQLAIDDFSVSTNRQLDEPAKACSKCPDSWSCCSMRTDSGIQTACCPFEGGICCPDQEFCCPSNSKCTLNGRCLSDQTFLSFMMSSYSKRLVLPASSPDPIPVKSIDGKEMSSIPGRPAILDERMRSSTYRALKSWRRTICPDNVHFCSIGQQCCASDTFSFTCAARKATCCLSSSHAYCLGSECSPSGRTCIKVK